MKIINTIIIVIISTVGLIGLVYARKLISIAAAYQAKVLCSAVFVSGRNPQSVLQDEFGIASPSFIMRIIATEVDFSSKQVTASFLGMVKRTAVYQPGLGSTLVYANLGLPHSNPNTVELSRHAGMDRQNLGYRDVLGPRRPCNLDCGDPYRNDGGNPNSTQVRFNALLDWAFAEPDAKNLRLTRAVVILHQGKIVAERYAPGFDQAMPLPGWSMAKSVVNALVGILVGQGSLDLSSPAPVPEWQGTGDPRREITLDQLMRMSSGLEFSEKASNPLSDVTQMLFTSPDAAAYAASKPLQARPGTGWNYASGTTNIISQIMRDTLGEVGYRQFPCKALFDPLGMDSAVFESDASGTFVGSSFLYATARDWAKLGQLYCQDGVWEGQRILPEGWVNYSNTPTPSLAGRQYGAHFWLDIGQAQGNSDLEQPLPADAFHATGYEGQYVSIIPSQQLVVVRLGLTRKSSAWRQDRFLKRIIDALAKIDLQHFQHQRVTW